MIHRRLIAAGMAALLLVEAAPAAADALPKTWDGLVQVPSKRLKYVYLQPGADFSGYTKVMIEPTEIAFRKDWARNQNFGSRDLARRISDSDVEKAISAGVKAAGDIFTSAWTKGGYAVSDAPGPDVLRVKTGIVNISVTAPDKQTAGRNYSFSQEAGEATLFVEVRDSETGALLGRAVDPRVIGDNTRAWRTSVSNRGDFRDMAEIWAKATVDGMAALKASSPVQP